MKYFEGRIYGYFKGLITDLDVSFNAYEELKNLPDTPKHREEYPHLYTDRFYYFPVDIKRSQSGNWCGYVDVSLLPWKDDYEDILYVHGGITYNNKKESRIGFDCAHYNDDSPFSTTVSNTRLYRDKTYVMTELKNLCKQLFDMFLKDIILKSNWSYHKQHPIKEIQESMMAKYLIWHQRKQSSSLSYIVEKDLWVKIINEAFKLEIISM